MMREISLLEQSKDAYHIYACKMGVSALSAYHEYFKEEDSLLNNEIHVFISKYKNFCNGKYGGTLNVKKDDLTCNISECEKLFRTRHSIRHFSKNKKVSELDIQKAIELAQHAPSACNRQAVRVYCTDEHSSEKISKSLSGIGGFANDVERFLLVCGKTSSYRADETYQYIVSASIFAGYLSLSLHLYGIGACIVQRSVLWNRKWNEIKKLFDIPEDEHLVCILAIGSLPEELTVPVSYRMPTEIILKNI